MLNEIKHAFANLTNINGRDGRQTFWYWVLFVVLLRYAIGLLVAIPMMVGMFSSMFASIKSGAGPEAMQQEMMGSVAGSLDYAMWGGLAVGVLTLPLMAASLVRRLHDSNMSGWWVLAPGLPYVAALANMPMAMARAKELITTMDPAHPPTPWSQMQGQELQILLTYLPILLVIWFGLRKSTDGPNRFGDAPVTF